MEVITDDSNAISFDNNASGTDNIGTLGSGTLTINGTGKLNIAISRNLGNYW